MSLSLIQGYSSAEEEQDEDQPQPHNSDLEDSDDDDAAAGTITAANHPSLGDRSIFDHVPNPPSASGLPSAFDAFSEIAGPPQFLNNSVEEYKPSRDADEQQGKHANRRRRKNKKDLPTGAVVEAKPQLVGIHERVRSDINGSQPPTSAALGTSEGGKRVPTATNPNAEDAADLLRMCLQCGIPKTYSNARGMVCPVCGDRPPKDDTSAESKKKGSTVKDKEKSKRMKGQSSHATWKSETEMHLRQQFD
ncbi:hypothetical protein AAZX31_08G071200 [Glycine max]|uniref:Uncharacterized protein n=2 Tax=Glycine subgen. Soja TaxID=1462606 RepID=I1KR39_SOYBN|nr:uncharacterized protein LOC100780521 isoform X1 [Glycine max]XP_028243105.1 uncharacterized protein LOC114421408 isoform X1 [Glycine soja]KAG4999536.1 hypothetical protein JHK87_020608 [Glycine soja]KAG5015020.1 hypothetical protein JHK85_021156 [Glycine max]KAG5024807.1 hypothetical protein JHK86_020721 [Glycine max]KAG5135980.1 hypothetical protein JHK82_020711 [Glycine max]KAH1050093.1 hypothetical protein GYH30_020523 [Glycine max]|eukprot:XP_003531037.1 uncharacterized protein LOC100780521 isoform X1 [Glycine max]